MAEDDKSKKPSDGDADRDRERAVDTDADTIGQSDEDTDLTRAAGPTVDDRDVRDPEAESDLPGDARDPLTGPDKPAAGSDPDPVEAGPTDPDADTMTPLDEDTLAGDTATGDDDTLTGTAPADGGPTATPWGRDTAAGAAGSDTIADDGAGSTGGIGEGSLFAAGAPVREEADTTLAMTDTIGAGTRDDDTLASADRDDTVDDRATSTGPNAAPVTRHAASSGPERVVEKRGGFFSAFLGGVVAAVGGFLLAQYMGPTGWPFANVPEESSSFEDETRAVLEQTRSGLDALTGRIGGVETGLGEIDLSTVETSVADLAERTSVLGGELTSVQARVDEIAAEVEQLGGSLSDAAKSSSDLGERLTSLEKRPVEETVSPEAIEAYEREIAALQSAVEEQRAAIETSMQEQGSALEQALTDQRASLDEMIAEQSAALNAMIEEQRAELASERSALEQMVAEAQEAEQDATRQAMAAQLRAAMAELVTAVDNGQPYAEELAPLTGAELEVPAALSDHAESGVATLSALVDTYPEAARDALAAARSRPEEGGNRVTGFFQGQFGVRSVTPREGNDADAVLSRAEASLRAGDIPAALDELSALPEEAQAAMSGWIDRARARTDATAAAQALAQQLNQE